MVTYFMSALQPSWRRWSGILPVPFSQSPPPTRHPSPAPLSLSPLESILTQNRASNPRGISTYDSKGLKVLYNQYLRDIGWGGVAPPASLGLSAFNFAMPYPLYHLQLRENKPLNPLSSAVSISLDLNSFRICSYKNRGVGGRRPAWFLKE